MLGPKSLSKLAKIFAHPSIKRRHIAVKEIDSLVDEDPDRRIARFTKWAVALSAQAVKEAIDQAGITTDDITGLVVNTCTGYICPGISTYLIEELGLSSQTRSYDLVGSGCGGAIPNLQISGDMIKGDREGIVVSVSVEICSATFQMADNLGLIVSNAIFADGAAASVLWDRPGKLELITSRSRCVPEYREDIQYIYRNGQLHNQLSLQLTGFASKTVASVVKDLLKTRGLCLDDIDHWAIHPGGENIISAVRDELRIDETKLEATRNILARYGNMSSPTVLFVLRELLLTRIKSGDWCIMVAFGAGLSAHGFLLKA
ncbi:MAG: hypothetical protein SCALA701_26330 [Candidatus Scalindua sp.]|nr:MAG: hypothetical protein SCALA701_26330 [Candidatus Scalindua sp.]